jgi:3-methyladenine DNA glycosylase AlkD
MTTSEIVEKLKALGSDQIRRILMNHGAKEPVFGVKIEELKKILKTEKGNNPLALELFQTGIYDAMYLAGLIADGARMSVEEIRGWAETAYGSGISEYTVPWVATENPHGYELAKEWIESPDTVIAATGWSTFSNIVSVWPDDQLDHDHLSALLARVEKTIHPSPDGIRGAMNGFVICVGCYVPNLMEDCLATTGRIGVISMVKSGKACKIPSAADYIAKVNKMGRTGLKRKMVKC